MNTNYYQLLKRKLKSGRLFLCYVLCFYSSFLFAQTTLSDAELNNRYFTYKDRYLKHFTMIGKERGHSIPIIKITRQVQRVKDKNTGAEKYYTGKIEFGDAMIDMGNYLAVLATEYKLRKEKNKDLIPVLNELYYAIETINRVDQFAEKYFDKLNSGQIDGFFVRSDVEEGFYKKWEAYGDPIYFQKSDCGSGRYTDDVNKVAFGGSYYFRDDNGDYIIEDWYNPIYKESSEYSYSTGKGYGNRVNEQSQDHTFGILFGLTFINEFVDNIYVKPKNNGLPDDDRGFKLIDEVKLITDRIISKLAERKTLDGQSDPDQHGKVGLEGFTPGQNQVKKVSADWIVGNSVKGTAVYRGPVATQLGFAYPAMAVGNRILGRIKNEWNPDPFIDIWYKKPVISTLALASWPPSGGLYLPNVKYIFPVKDQYATWWSVFGNSSPQSFYNRNHIFKMAAMSGLVEQNDYYNMVNAGSSIMDEKRPYFEIVNAVLNHHITIENKLFYQEILSNTYCDGNRHFNHPPDYSKLRYFANEDIFSFSNYLDDEGHPKEGEYNGLDYMLMYNLYRMAFDSQISTPYETQFCPCKGSRFFKVDNIENGSNLTSINSLKDDVVFRFPDYKDYKLPIPEFLTHDFTINNGGLLKPQGDITICNSKSIVKSGGELSTSINTDGNWHKTITVGRNGVLELEANCTLRIENNTMMKIEKGATLIIHPSAQIILNGPNAVLHINGKMILKPDAEFNPIAGTNGYGKVIFENNAGELYVTCEGNNKVIINPGTRGTHINLEAKGAYGMHTGWQPNLRLFEVKNAKVSVAPGSKITSEADRTVIDNIHMMGHNWPQNENEYSNGLELISTYSNIQNSTFDFLENAIEFKYHPYGPSNLRQTVKNNIIWRCKNGLKLNGGAVTADGNQFSAHRIGVKGLIAVSPNGTSIIKNNVFNVTQGNSSTQWSWDKNSPKMAIHYMKTGALTLIKNKFNSSNYAINSMDGNLSLLCNSFYAWDDMSSAYYAIKARNGGVKMPSGHNLFEHYQHYITAERCRLFINNGYNMFDINSKNYPFIIKLSPYHLTFDSDIYTDANSKTNIKAILATNNYWQPSNSNTNSTLFRPYNKTNENIYITNGTGFFDLGYKPTLNASGNYLGIQNTYCSQNFAYNPRTNEPQYEENTPSISFLDLNEPFFEGLIVPIKPPTIGTGETYQEVMSTILLSINDGIIDYTTVLPDLAHLSKVSIPTRFSDVTYQTYSLMHEVYGDGLHDTLNHDSISVYINTYGNMLLANQDTLINRCLNNDSFWSSMRYELFRDKAMLLRSLDRRDEAIVLLDSTIVDPLIPDMLKSHATAWRCVINQEVMLIDSVITIADIDFELCMPEDSMQVNSPYTFVESDTAFYLCNADSINGNHLTKSYTVLDTLPYVVYNAYSDTVFADTLQQFTLPLGDYTVEAIDTGLQIVYLHYIHIVQNRDCYPEVIEPTYTSTDTTFYLCYDGVQPLDSVYYVYQADSTLPYVLIKNTSDTISQNVNHQYHLSFGNYTFAYVDTSLNLFKNDYVKIDFNDTCTMVPEEYTFQVIDTTFSICFIDSSNIDLLTYHYQPDTTLPYAIYNEFIDTVFTDTLHSYRLPLGNFVYVGVDSINNILHLTYIHIVSQQEQELNFIDTITIDCEALPYNFNSNFEQVKVFENNVLMDSTTYNQYVLSPTEYVYRTEYRNSGTCQFEKRIFNFTDVLQSPPTDPSAYVFAKYDRTEDTCAFVRLSELSCNGSPIHYGKTIEIYNMDLQYLYTATIEQYGSSTIGFKFCPPYWNTDTNHIHDWHNFIYKANLCEYCRIDFKADSLVIFPYVLSVNELNFSPKVSIYPNPSKSHVVIQVKNPNQANLTIQITDNMGRLIVNETKSINTNGEIPVSLENYTNGIYFIKIPELNFDGKVVLIKE